MNKTVTNANTTGGMIGVFKWLLIIVGVLTSIIVFGKGANTESSGLYISAVGIAFNTAFIAVVLTFFQRMLEVAALTAHNTSFLVLEPVKE